MKHMYLSSISWIEQYTNIHVGRMLNHSGWVFVGQIATSLSAFTVMVVLANLVSRETLGEYRFVVSIVSILIICTLPGLDIALVQSTARGFKQQLQRTTYTKMRWGLIGAVLAWLGAGYFFYSNQDSLGWAFVIVGAFMPLYGSYFTYFFFLQGKQQFQQAAITQAASRILFLIIMIVTAYIIPTSTALIAAFMIATIIGQYLGFWFTKRQNLSNEGVIDTDLVSYGKYMTLVGMFPIVAAHFDKTFIWSQIGAVELAVYSIAMLIPAESGRLGRIISQVSLPSFSRKTEVTHIARHTMLLISFSFLVWLLYVYLAPYLFAIFFPTYPESVFISQIGMLVIICSPIFMLRSLLISQKNKRGLSTATIGSAILQLIASVVLIYLFGIMGAVVAFVGGSVIELIILMILVRINKNRPEPAVA